MSYANSEIKSQPAIQQVERAFVAKLHKQDVLFIKSEGNSPVAYRLPSGFLEKLKASAKRGGLFPLGKTLITPGAMEALQDSEHSASEFLSRHQQGDRGDVDAFDWKENDNSINGRFRI